MEKSGTKCAYIKTVHRISAVRRSLLMIIMKTGGNVFTGDCFLKPCTDCISAVIVIRHR